MTKPNASITPNAIILAAGNSSRMGIPKWKLITSSGDSFALHLFRQFQALDIPTVMVVRKEDMEEIRAEEALNELQWVVNDKPEWGRLYSLQCGLKALPNTADCFVQNIDNPYLTPDLLQMLITGRDGADYALPCFEDRGGHPLLLGSELVRKILEINQEYPQLRQLLQSYNGNRLEAGTSEILTNINTVADYNLYISCVR